MKNILLILLLAVAGTSAMNAQDVITLKNGNEVKAKVLEVGTTEVKYKKYGSESGPTYTEAKAAIFMIRYEDGTKDVFGSAQESTTTSRPQQQRQQRQQQASRPVAAETAAAQPRQDDLLTPFRNKAYVGIGVGAAIPSESDLYDTGVQVTVNFGYLFTEHVGITATGFLTTLPMDVFSDATMGLTGLLAGPLFSMPANATRSIELDLRPTIGYAQVAATVGSLSATDDELIFAFGIGGSARFNLSRHFSLSANLDYIHGNIGDYDISLSSVGISVGANYCF